VGRGGPLPPATRQPPKPGVSATRKLPPPSPAARPGPTRRGTTRPGTARPSTARPRAARPGPARRDPARPGPARPRATRPDPTRPDPGRIGAAQRGSARLSAAQRGSARLSAIRPDPARHGATQRGTTPRGAARTARHGATRRGTTPRGTTPRGQPARHGTARQGEARRGEARICRASSRNATCGSRRPRCRSRFGRQGGSPVMVMVCGYWPGLSATMIPTRHRRPLTPGQGCLRPGIPAPATNVRTAARKAFKEAVHAQLGLPSATSAEQAPTVSRREALRDNR
jgi:hypothetical protein